MMIAAIALVGLLLAAVFVRYPGLLIIPALALVWRFTRKKHTFTAHGRARFADIDDVKRAGMTGGDGLPVGYIETARPTFWQALNGLFDKRIPDEEACRNMMVSMRKLQRVERRREEVRLNRAVHTAVFAPTGAGKGVSLVIPFLLSNRDSCVVIDPKGENAILTAAARRAMGHEVILLDPFKVVTQEPDTLNPLDAIDNTSDLAVDEIRSLAEAIVVRQGTEHDPHWNDSAEALIAAMIGATCAFLKGDDRSLQSVRALLTDDKERVAATTAMKNSPVWGGMLARMGGQAGQFVERELASVLTTANRHMNFLDTLAVAANTQKSSFNPERLRQGRMTVYLILPPERLRTQTGLLRLWITAMLQACVRGGLDESRRVTLLLDEAASLGVLQQLEDAVDKYRAYGVRCIFVYQAIPQLKKCWRPGMDEALLANTTQVYFGIQEYQTAAHVSKQLGQATIVVASGGTSGGGSSSESMGASPSRSNSANWGHSDSWQQQGRPLMRPEELMTANPRMAITFAPATRPICTYLTRYYERQPGGSRWRGLQTTAEVWLTAALMLLLATLGVWAAATIPIPQWR
jgi:type IV secretion system protein VirD4